MMHASWSVIVHNITYCCNCCDLIVFLTLYMLHVPTIVKVKYRAVENFLCINICLYSYLNHSINQFIEGFISYAGGHPGTGQRLTLCIVVTVLA